MFKEVKQNGWGNKSSLFLNSTWKKTLLEIQIVNSHQQKLCSNLNQSLGEPTAATGVRHCQPSSWRPCLWSTLLPWQHSQQNGTKWAMTVLSHCTAWIISTSHLLWQFSLNSIRWDTGIFPPLCFAMVPVTATEAGTEKFHLRRKVTLSATTATAPELTWQSSSSREL